MARMDFTVGIQIFKEQFGRDPRPTEMLKVQRAQISVFAAAPPAELEQVWGEAVTNAAPDVENWDEFALVGCLDGHA